jgi:multidrug efflux pump subunit AcrA (membrane-fusion protein)
MDAMKVQDLRLAGGLMLCLGMAVSPALAQSGNLDAKTMPRDRSTPAEQAETAKLNLQINQANSAAQAQYDQAQAQYQAKQREYQEALQKSEAAQQRYQEEKAAFDKGTAEYEAQRAQYRAKRGTYRHYDWPSRYAGGGLEDNAGVMNAGVELINGNRVGKVVGLAHARDDKIEAVKIQLDNGKLVWIDAADARFDDASGTVVTDLYAQDLQQMAGGGTS